MIGAVAVLSPMALLPVLGVWLAAVMLTGFVGLGTMLGTAALPVYFALARPDEPAAARVRPRRWRHSSPTRTARTSSACATATKTARAGCGCCGRDEHDTPSALIALLADGEMHSGGQLAAELGVSRAAVWKRRRTARTSASRSRASIAAVTSSPAPSEMLDVERDPCVAAARAGRCRRNRGPVRDRGRPTNISMPRPRRRPAIRDRVRRAAERGPRPARPLLAGAVRFGPDILDRLDVRGHAGRPLRAQPRDGRAVRAHCGSRCAARRCSSGRTTSCGGIASSADC